MQFNIYLGRVALDMLNIKRCNLLWTALFVVYFWAFSSIAYELEPVIDQPEAIDFTLIDLGGNPHNLSQYRGKVVLVSFWATWCPECVWEMPSLQTISTKFPNDNFILLAINVGEERSPVESFARHHKITFPILLDHDMETYKKWPVLGVPTSFIIDQQGKVVYTIVGAIDWTEPETLTNIERLFTHNPVAHQ